MVVNGALSAFSSQHAFCGSRQSTLHALHNYVRNVWHLSHFHRRTQPVLHCSPWLEPLVKTSKTQNSPYLWGRWRYLGFVSTSIDDDLNTMLNKEGWQIVTLVTPHPNWAIFRFHVAMQRALTHMLCSPGQLKSVCVVADTCDIRTWSRHPTWSMHMRNGLCMACPRTTIHMTCGPNLTSYFHHGREAGFHINNFRRSFYPSVRTLAFAKKHHDRIYRCSPFALLQHSSLRGRRT